MRSEGGGVHTYFKKTFFKRASPLQYLMQAQVCIWAGIACLVFLLLDILVWERGTSANELGIDSTQGPTNK